MNYLRQQALPDDVEIKNDMIERVKIRRDRGFILGLYVEMKSGRQPFFCGYHNTDNIGRVILALAELLGVNQCGESNDILADFANAPCRVASNGELGDEIAKTTWIGHFMDDQWLCAIDIIRAAKREAAK